MPAFRFQAKRVLLTFSDVCADITKEAVYYTIDERYPIARYALGEERHESGGRHIHALLEFSRKVSSLDPGLFDVADQEHNHHPNIQVLKKGQAHWDRALDYVTKEDPLPFANVETRLTWQEIFDTADCKEEFLRLVLANYPRDYALNLQRLEYTADKRWPQRLCPNTIWDWLPTYSIILPAELQLFRPSENSSTVVVGPPGCGKTTWAKMYSPKPSLFVRHLDSLRQLRAEHRSIIFDDLDFCHLPPHAQKFLCDQSDLAEVHIRYQVARIPAGLTRIFTANEYPFLSEGIHAEAIRRRINRIDIL